MRVKIGYLWQWVSSMQGGLRIHKQEYLNMRKAGDEMEKGFQKASLKKRTVKGKVRENKERKKDQRRNF